MGRETNIESIRALEKQIEEGKGDKIQLKRARNSLLNISTRVPPEILGEVFSWTLVRGDPTSGRDSHFDGFPEGSYNFLLVCHHWFNVASHTPKLWTFWGNTVEEWKKLHHRHPQVAPLDLVLNGLGAPATSLIPINGTLEDVLRDRATRDTVRQVHLSGCIAGVISSIISVLTPVGEGVQHRSIESIDLRKWGIQVVDVSEFFVRIRLPKLRSLLLSGALILPPWDHLARQTTLLTTLSLTIYEHPQSPPPTASQLFSILVSNPGLQSLTLANSAIPEGDGGGPVPQVTLRHLKNLYLKGQLRCIFDILDRLSFPRPLDSIEVVASDSTVEAASQEFGSYLRLYFQPGSRFQGRLRTETHSSRNQLSIRVETEDDFGGLSMSSAKFTVCLVQGVPGNDLQVTQHPCHHFVGFTPREHACSFSTNIPLLRLGDILIAVPGIEMLDLFGVALFECFLRSNPDGPHTTTGLPPSLRSLNPGDLALGYGDRRSLVTYLGHQTSDGKPIPLRICGFIIPHVCPEVVKEMKDRAGEFGYKATMATEHALGCCEGREGFRRQGDPGVVEK